MKLTKEKLLKEFREKFRYKFDICNKDEKIEVNGNWLFIEQFIKKAISQIREETIRDLLSSVQENRDEFFKDKNNSGRLYYNGLVDLLNKILDNLKK